MVHPVSSSHRRNRIKDDRCPLGAHCSGVIFLFQIGVRCMRAWWVADGGARARNQESRAMVQVSFSCMTPTTGSMMAFGSCCICGVALEGVESQVRYPRSLLPHGVCRGMSEIAWLMRGHPHHPIRHAVSDIWIHARTKGVLVAVGHAVFASIGIVAHIQRSWGYPLPSINTGSLFSCVPRGLFCYVA